MGELIRQDKQYAIYNSKAVVTAYPGKSSESELAKCATAPTSTSLLKESLGRESDIK